MAVRRWAVFGATTLAVLLTQVASAVPATVLQWAALAVGALVTGVLATVAVPGGAPDDGADDDGGSSLRDRIDRWRLWLREHWKLTAAVVAGLGLLLTLGGLELLRDVSSCPPVTQLRLVTDPETLTTARGLATAYERSTAARNDGCPTARIYVYAAADAATIRNRLDPSDGWSDRYGALSRVGPRPDIWLAGTGHQVDLVNGDGVIGRSTPVARSPLVLAVPGPRPEATPDTWSGLFGRYTDGVPRVIRGNPAADDLDMLATVALYESEPADGRPLRAVEIERRIQSAVDAGRFPLLGDATDLLCRRRQLTAAGPADAPPGALDIAIIATEQQVIRYNVGDPLGGPCGTRVDPLPEPQQLHAVYPADRVDQDLQFVELAWSTPAQRRAATAFREWLDTDGGRRAIVRTGLRPDTGDYPILEPLTVASGIDPNQSPPSGPVDPGRWSAAATVRKEARRPSTLLFAVDGSGSMAAAGPSGTRQQVAATAILSGLTGLGPADQFALWSFPDAAGTGHQVAVPLGPRDEPRLAAARTALTQLRPAGNTPLYRTIVDGAELLARTGDPDDETAFRALVVLTDGEDTTSGIDAAAAVQAAASRQVRVVLVTVGEIRCSNPGLITITNSTGNACVDADLTDVDARVNEVVAELKGGEDR